MLKNSNVIETELPLLGRGLGRGLFCLLLTAHCLLATAQSFPVQVIPQVTPPSPIYFSDYANASTVSSPLRVQIILNDFEIANREIRLRTYFEGGGIAFQSNDVVVGASPLFLEGGVQLILTNVELAPYFRFENISGISPNVYGQAIPEGAYQFCFEVFDVLTGNRISQKSCVTSVVFQNEPPFLISPRNKTNVEEINPQNIVFQWTPRHINVTNVEYELSIVEIWDTQVDPQQAFLSSPPVFQTTTTATTYVYGPADPLFLSGKNYAWRVQAKAKQGVEEIGLFENQGYSEIYSFSYAGSCDLPLGINHEVKGSTNANIFWDDFSTDIPEYTVRYRKKAPSGEGNEWFSNKTTTNQTTLWDLKAGTVYEYQVRKKCAITESDWSLAKQFTTFIADDEASVYECGITPDFTLSNKEPLPNISSGEAFTAGDFPIKILEVSGSNGRFTGKGYVTIPYLNSIKVGVEFTNVLLNTDKQLAEGTVKTMYDPSLKNILDIDEAIETVENAVDAVGEFFEGDNDLDEIRVNWEISRKDITIEDGMVVITNPYNGVTESEPLGDDMVIVDSEGNTYYVDADGSVTEGGQIDQGSIVNSDNVEGVSNNGQLKELTAKGIKVTFTDKGTYGMDLLPQSANAKLKSEYTLIKDADGKDYPLAHHAVKKNGTTQIQANIDIAPGSVYSVEDIIFKNKQGQEITADINDNKAILTLNGTYTFENETIYATVQDPDDDSKELTAGAFTLWHLTEKTINVVLVSVNGGQLGDVQTKVNNIFKQGVTQINFGEPINLKIDKNLFGNNGLDVGESAWTKAYNEEQKEFIRLAKNAGAKKSDTYYILVCGPDITNTKGIAGFMPLQRQFGFVFQNYVDTGDEGKGNVAKTLAHEIGHGVFALQHPFSQYGMPKETTDWLMDYDNGAVLPHTHWAQMHDPAIKFYVFQEEEEGQNWAFSGSNVSFAKVSEDFGKNIDNTFTFVTPAGDFIDLPANVLDVTFYYGIQNPGIDSKSMPGTLFSFKLIEGENTIRYKSVIKDGVFLGFISENNDDVYKSSSSDGQFHIMFLTGSVDKANLYLVESNALTAYNGTAKRVPEIFDFPIWPYRTKDNIKKTKAFSVGGMFGNSQTKYKQEILQQVFKYVSEDESLLLKNRILEVAHAYPSLFDKSSNKKFFDNWQACDTDYVNTLYGFERELIKRYCKCEFITTGDNEPDDVTPSGYYVCKEKKQTPQSRFHYLKEYYSFLLDYVKNQQGEAHSLLDAIYQDPSLIDRTAINELSNAINASSEIDISKTINVELIYRIISKILSNGEITEGSTFTTQYERSVLHLLNTVVNRFDVAEKGELLEKIESKNYYKNLPSNDKYLYEQLFNNINDDLLFGLTSNNRKELILSFTKIVIGATEFYDTRLNEAIENIGDRIFIFEYNNFVKNTGIEILANNVWVQIADNITEDAITKNLRVKDISYDFNPDGTMHLEQTDDLGFSRSTSIFSPETDLKPFDLVLFSNRSNLTLLKEYEKSLGYTGNLPLPAIALAYAAKTGNTETTVEGINTALDIASLIGTGGTLSSVKGLSKLRKILLVSDLASSGASIVATSISDSPELGELKRALDIFSTTTGVVGAFDNLVTADSKSMREIISDVAKNYKGSNDIPTINQINAVLDGFDNLDEAKLLRLVSQEKDAVKYIELVFVKLLKDAADAGNVEHLNRVRAVIKRLKNAKIVAETTSFIGRAGEIIEGEDNLLSWIKTVAGDFKSFTYKIGINDNGIDIVKQKRAGTFWNLKGRSPTKYTQYISKDGKFYIKLVPVAEDGRLLFFDIEKNHFLGWGLLPKTKSNKLLNPLKSIEDYETLINELKFIHGFERITTQLDFGEKGNLVRYVDKLNAYLGSYNPSRTASTINELGTKDVLERLNMYRNYRFAEKGADDFELGSISLLNLPDEMAYQPNTNNFFEDFNKEYLDFLIKHKGRAAIIFTTNPKHAALLKAWRNGKYLQNEFTGLFEPSGFAKEIKYLRDRGVSKVKFKDGSDIDLNSINLDGLDWTTNWKY